MRGAVASACAQGSRIPFGPLFLGLSIRIATLRVIASGRRCRIRRTARSIGRDEIHGTGYGQVPRSVGFGVDVDKGQGENTTDGCCLWIGCPAIRFGIVNSRDGPAFSESVPPTFNELPDPRLARVSSLAIVRATEAAMPSPPDAPALDWVVTLFTAVLFNERLLRLLMATESPSVAEVV